MTTTQRLTLIAAIFFVYMAPANGQSSANFRLEGGRVSSTSAANTPTSSGFRAEGGMGTDAISGVAASANFSASSGVPVSAPTLPERIFVSGFEN